MNLIFLDIDGVLNSYSHPGDSKGFGIDIFHVNILWEIIEKTDSKIIISSSWRYGGIGPGSDLHSSLFACGPAGVGVYLRIIGQTRNLADEQLDENLSLREAEIIDYIEKNNIQYNFLILDDIQMNKLNNRQILTDSKFGLLESDIEKAIEILNQ